MDMISEFVKFRWPVQPVCSYCKSIKVAEGDSSGRFYCKTCRTSFSVKTSTPLQNSKLPLIKWLDLFWLVIEKNEKSATKLAREINLNRKTASKLILTILVEYKKDVEFRQIVQRANDHRRLLKQI